MHFFGQVTQSHSGSILPSARNTSGMIPNQSMNLKVNFSLQENQPGSNSVHIVGAGSSVVFEQNPAQDSQPLCFFTANPVELKGESNSTEFALDFLCASFDSQQLVLFQFYLFEVFSEIAALLCSNAISQSFYEEGFCIKCVIYPKSLMNRAVHCSSF